MKGDPKVVEALIKAASMELALSVQYGLDSRDARYRGLKTLSRKFCKFADDGRGYLEEITDRVLFLEGEPAYASAAAAPADSVTATLQRALDAETAIVGFFNDAAIVAMQVKDDNTRNKFEHWVKWHEDGPLDWLERQLAQIRALGEIEYVKVQLGLS